MTTPQQPPENNKREKKWTGKHVLIAMCTFFGVIFVANYFMVTLGIRSFPGEDTKQSYRQGLEYNKTLAKRAAQHDLGWQADISFADSQHLTLRITNKDGAAVKDLKVTGVLKHLANIDRDVTLKFAQAANGSYIAPIDTALLGKQWMLSTAATQSGGAVKFETHNEIWLK